MIIDTLGGYNVTPEITHFSGRLRRLNIDDVHNPDDLRFNEASVLYLEGNTTIIPQILKAQRPNVSGVLFAEGGGFFHPALCLSAEGVPCAVKPKQDITPLEGKQVTVDLSSGQILTDDDAKKFSPKHKSQIIVDSSIRTEAEVSAYVRSMRELKYLEGIAQQGVKPKYIVLSLEPTFYETYEDPYKLVHTDPGKLTRILKPYIIKAAEIPEAMAYVRTPEITGPERGVNESHTSGIAELRGAPYDVHKDQAFFTYLFRLIEDIRKERPDIAEKIGVVIAMPRSSDDMTESIRIMEQNTSLRAGQNINVTGFLENPYWFMPSSTQSPDVRRLTNEPIKEESLKDKGKNVFWGTGDLNSCMMAASREIPQMKAYLAHRADFMESMRKSIHEWSKLWFRFHLAGGPVWRPYKTDEENIQLYDILLRNGAGVAVKPEQLLDVRRIVNEMERRRNMLRGPPREDIERLTPPTGNNAKRSLQKNS